MASLLSIHDFSQDAPATGPDHKPQSLWEIDISPKFLKDLALKILYEAGSISVLELSQKLRLSFDVTLELFDLLRAQQLCRVTGMTCNVAQIAITSEGKSHAIELLSQSHYSGPAPVSLESYSDQTRLQSVRDVEVHHADVERAFANLVIADETLRQFGTALNSGGAIFLYGPSGVGKTTMAEALAHVLAKDEVWIPYAVEIDGSVVTVYDSMIHRRIPDSEPRNRDERWVLCHRPSVLTGGEMTLDMLDLQFNPTSNFYVGPLQMKANNGVLIIDDFGRQQTRPEDILNRWIVPLDRRIDFLTLAGGRKFEIPFELVVVFASNMDPAELVDASFLRRIQTKIEIGAVSDKQFSEIFHRVAAEHKTPYDADIPNDLIDFIRCNLKQELRSCYPRDIVNQVCWAARYEGRKPYLNHTALMQAVSAYFLP